MVFEHAADLPQIARVYMAMHALESEYRGGGHSREDSLTDTIRACLALTASRRRVLARYPDAALLHDGFRRLRGHLAWEGFGGQEVRRLAARAGFLARQIQAGRSPDLGGWRYTGSSAQIDLLRSATLNSTDYAWLDYLKGANLEAFHYWYHGFRQAGG